MARSLFGLLAAGLFVVAGFQMLTLHSQGGNTVAEAFDNYVGIFSFGMAALSIVIATPARPTDKPAQ